ncbi:MAG: DUF2812 domain-containing protein [Firmicutes bacterium]|nr:DUF2812 domain-containing protein [Bacillota bacterium]
MSEIIRKKYRVWDFDEEEKWVNAMAKDGKGLVDAGSGQYVFEEEEPGGFLYRQLFLKRSASSDRGRYEIALEEENGWKLICARGRRAWMKRPNDSGYYDLLSDAGNKRRLLKRIRSGLILAAAALFCIAFYELFSGMVGQNSIQQYLALALILAGMFLLAVIIRISGTLRWLKNRKR